MKLTAFAAAAAVIAVPMAVQGAPTPDKAPTTQRRVCTVQQTLGSRVNNVRRCRTRDEREAEKQEAKQTVDRVQQFRPCNGNAAFGRCGC